MSLPKPKKYIKEFENMAFGMFVHFGLYSILEQGEWTARLANIPESEYKTLMNKFNPKSMSDIVNTAKSAGAKYICLTTRHHDGFSLYDTCGLNEYDAPHSAAGRDLVREFVDECRKNDIVPFFYHTTLEFWNKEFDNDFAAYLEYLRKSVEILCTRYGKIGGFWFDGNWSKPDSDWEEDKLYKMIRKYQPDAMIINNTGLQNLGSMGNEEIDSVTFERGKPFIVNQDGQKKYIAGEVCDAVNNHWGRAHDFNCKSPGYLIKELCDSRKFGANFLLNIGPLADGSVSDYDKSVFSIIGKWMELFGEAIYNPRPYWTKQDSNCFVLKNDRSLYFFYYDLCRRGSESVSVYGGSEGKQVFDNFSDKIKKIYWLDNHEMLEFEQNNDSVTVDFTGYDYGHDYCVRVAKAEI